MRERSKEEMVRWASQRCLDWAPVQLLALYEVTRSESGQKMKAGDLKYGEGKKKGKLSLSKPEGFI